MLFFFRKIPKKRIAANRNCYALQLNIAVKLLDCI